MSKNKDCLERNHIYLQNPLPHKTKQTQRNTLNLKTCFPKSNLLLHHITSFSHPRSKEKIRNPERKGWIIEQE